MDRITAVAAAAVETGGKQEMSMSEGIFARIWPLSERITTDGFAGGSERDERA